ncbi:MAG: hypothetical protein KF774_18205 [Planctomyces sp.]|nr:hypothetical protein [Planctomyces sp.]
MHARQSVQAAAGHVSIDGHETQLRISGDGVFLRTPETRVAISGDGVVVSRVGESWPVVAALPDQHQHAYQGRESLAVGPLIAICVVLLLLLQWSRKAVVVAILIGVALVGIYRLRQGQALAHHRARVIHTQQIEEQVRADALHREAIQVRDWRSLEKPLPVAAPGSLPSPPAPPLAEAVSTAAESVAPAQPAEDSATDGDWRIVDAEPAESGTERILTADQLPAWVAEAIRGDELRMDQPATISSGRFATIKEAEDRLWSEVRTRAEQLFVERQPEAAGWLAPPELLERTTLVLDRCVERTELVVGTFSEPMYQVHWRVVLPERLSETLASAWRPAVSNERLKTSGAVLGGATIAFGLMNLLLRGLTSARLRSWSRRKTAGTAVAAAALIGLGLWMV